MSERRNYRLYVLPQRFLKSIISGYALREGDVVEVLERDGLPEDCVVENVYFSNERGGYVAVVSHDSFDDVPEGMEPPYADTFGLERRGYYVVGEHLIVDLTKLSYEALERLHEAVLAEKRRKRESGDT